jgi:hypothetical protein
VQPVAGQIVLGRYLPGERPATAEVVVRGVRDGVEVQYRSELNLPRSSLLLLVAAFAGRENVLAAYLEAVREGYRFYSYGDAMLIQEMRC